MRHVRGMTLFANVSNVIKCHSCVTIDFLVNQTQLATIVSLNELRCTKAHCLAPRRKNSDLTQAARMQRNSFCSRR